MKYHSMPSFMLVASLKETRLTRASYSSFCSNCPGNRKTKKKRWYRSSLSTTTCSSMPMRTTSGRPSKSTATSFRNSTTSYPGPNGSIGSTRPRASTSSSNATHSSGKSTIRRSKDWSTWSGRTNMCSLPRPSGRPSSKRTGLYSNAFFQASKRMR